MKIYLAGNIAPQREKKLICLGGKQRLFSYCYHGPDGSFNQEFKVRLESLKYEK